MGNTISVKHSTVCSLHFVVSLHFRPVLSLHFKLTKISCYGWVWKLWRALLSDLEVGGDKIITNVIFWYWATKVSTMHMWLWVWNTQDVCLQGLAWEAVCLCTYQRPSRGVDPGEPPGICTKTFANSTYPGPIFFHKKLPMSLPQEHNLNGLPSCNVISCIILNKSLIIISTVSKNSQSICFLHTARFNFTDLVSHRMTFSTDIHLLRPVFTIQSYTGLKVKNFLSCFLPVTKWEKAVAKTMNRTE